MLTGLEPMLVVLAFCGGMLMFLAPCTLPLIPAYLGFISGVTEDDLVHPGTRTRARWLVVRTSLLFAVGFSTVFVTFGMLASFAGTFIGPVHGVLKVVAGIVLMLFGLFMLGFFTVPWLTKERRVHLPRQVTMGTPWSALAVGSAFAFGWTPCTGPLLGLMLTLASDTTTLVAGMFLLLVFSLGFSTPFILLAILIGQASRYVQKLLPYLHVVSMVGGVSLVCIGLFMAFGDLPFIRWFFHLFGRTDLGEGARTYLESLYFR